jgi:membrane associated rhomboid family serine protease
MDRDAEHLRLVSIFHYVLAGLHALLGCFGIIYVILGAVFVGNPQMFNNHNGQPDPPPALFGGMFIAFGAFFLFMGWVIAGLLACAGHFLGQRRHYMQGYLSLVLHAHLPFVRHPEHEKFLEENWLLRPSPKPTFR